jgi:hypothetical protein
MKTETTKNVFLIASYALAMLLVCILIILGLSHISDAVHAQNAGNTGTATISQPVVYTGTGPFISQIFTNVGQSTHWLQICAGSTPFLGTVDIEADYDGVTNFTPIAAANYQVFPLFNSCHILQASGYYQNVRSVVTVTGGSGFPTATYNASSGPTTYAPTGIGDTGPTAPLACTRSSAGLLVTPGSTTMAIQGVANTQTRVCAYKISVEGPATGLVEIQSSTEVAACAGGVDLWDVYFDGTSTPDGQGGGMGQLFPSATGNAICVKNGTGVNLILSFTFAQVSPGF